MAGFKGALPLLAAVVLTGACGNANPDAGPLASSEPEPAIESASQSEELGGDCQRVGPMDVGMLHLCFNPNADDHGRFIVGDGATRRELRVIPPGPTPSASAAGRVGHWAWAALSPDRQTLLATWSAECEVPIAFFADARGGNPTPVSGDEDWARSPVSIALGWTTDGRALVFLPEGSECGAAAQRPGIYAFSRAGAGTLILRTSGPRSPLSASKRPRTMLEVRRAGS